MYSDVALFLNALNETECHNLSKTRTVIIKQFNDFEYLSPMIAGVIMVLNLSVVFYSGIFVRRKYSPRPMYLFLGNISMADFFLGAITVFKQFFPRPWMTQMTCEILTGFLISVMFNSTLSIGMIAIDRFLHIVHGMKYRIWMYSRRARLMILVSWMMSFVVGFIPPLIWSQSINIDGDNLLCWHIILFPPVLELILISISFVPIITAIVIYSIILAIFLKKVRGLKQEDRSDSVIKITRFGEGGFRHSSSHPNEWRAIKVALLSAGASFFTWLPFIITNYLYMTCPATCTCMLNRLKLISTMPILVFVNSFLNPLIYAWWHNGFRSSIKKAFGVRNKKPIRETNNQQVYTIKIKNFDES